MKVLASVVRVGGVVVTAGLLMAGFIFHLRYGSRPDELEIRLVLFIAAFETTIICLGFGKVLDHLAESAEARKPKHPLSSGTLHAETA